MFADGTVLSKTSVRIQHTVCLGRMKLLFILCQHLEEDEALCMHICNLHSPSINYNQNQKILYGTYFLKHHLHTKLIFYEGRSFTFLLKF